MRVVFYCRMSRDDQENSIQDQRASLLRYAAEKGYKVVGEYIDEGISGDATEKRLGFQQMIQACKTRAFDAVLCWDQDRFGRFDPLEAGYWIKPMRDEGIVLETIAQGRVDWNDFAGRIVWSVTQEAKHGFLRDMARNCLRGNLVRVKTGASTGRPPFGYVRGDDGHYAPGEPDAIAAIRRAFELRLLGLGYRVIASTLNQEEHRSPSAARWSYDAVRIVLDRAETYAGTLVYGRIHRGRYMTTIDGAPAPLNGVRGKNKRPIMVPNAHPPLITEQTATAVIAMRLAPTKRYASSQSGGAPLAGLLFCGRCGKTMYSQSLQRQSGQRSPNYICSAYHQARGCGYCVVAQNRIHEALAEALKNAISGNAKELRAAIADRLNQRNEAGAVKELLAQEVRLSTRINEATDRILKVNERLVADLEKKLLDLHNQRDSIRMQIRAAQTSSGRVDVESVIARLQSLSRIFNDHPAAVRARLKTVVEQIRLDFEQGKRTNRGQSFVCVGATIEFKSVATSRLSPLMIRFR